MGKLATLLAKLDPQPGVRGRQFELICRLYLTTDPLYRRELVRVWLWDEWPGRWGADAGIDLVAEARDGGLWAIQAKAYDPRYRIKKSDVDTFLSESARPEFSFRLLIATTNEIGATARRTLEAQEKPGHLLFLADLERAALEWPTSPSKLVGKPAKPKRPRRHQRRAIRDVVRGFEDTDRGQLIMACGTGKTLTALWIREALAAERTLVLLPSLSLLAQTLREWVANAPHEFDFLPVCSDETVTGTDSPVSTTADLGFPVTTEPTEIASFLRKRGPRVIFSTYQSSPQVAKALANRIPGFDLAIADEAHRCAGRVSGDFATILDERAIWSKRRLFMTATPRYFTGRIIKEAAAADLEIASMDDEARFGPVLHRLTFRAAIEQDLLSDYQVAIVVVDDATFRGYAERGVFVTTDGEKVTDARTLAAQIGLAKAMRQFDLRRVVSFHSRVAWARDFSRSLPGVIAWMPRRQRPEGSVWSSYVSGEMASGHRDVLLGRLRDLDGERGLLCNARCLAEGVDVPTLDGVAFIDPRRSEVDIVQAVGRAIRKSPDKKVGTIVLPAFVRGGESLEADVESSAFEPVWEVLKALRAHDEQLAEELDELRREMGRRRTSARRPGKLKLLLPVGVGVDFARAFDTRLIEQTTGSWEFWFGLLERFVEREGHARVAHRYQDDGGYRLGAWVNTQRNARGQDALSTERIARLEAVPGWTWDAHSDAWEEGWAALLRFVEREGDAIVPQRYSDHAGFRLGQWVSVQRVKNQQGDLSEDRAARLEALPGWAWDAVHSRWEEGLAALQRFVEQEGDALVSQGHQSEDGFQLGRWTSRQRGAYTGGGLSQERIARLEALPGWAWDPVHSLWEEGFAAVQRFFDREGHALVPRGYRDDAGFRLGQWVGVQRTSYKGGTIAAEQVARLEAFPGWTWDPFAERWEKGFAALERFVDREGHARVPAQRTDVDGYRLGAWVNKQRAVYGHGVLSDERVARLEGLPGWTWGPHASRWERGFAGLQRYIERNGSVLVPVAYQDEEGFRLGAWALEQRTQYGRGVLDPTRIARLETLPGWTWDPFADRWENGFTAMQRFVEREGHARVPVQYRDDSGYPLGQWVHVQRQSSRGGDLDPTRIARLEALPGWVWRIRRPSRRGTGSKV